MRPLPLHRKPLLWCALAGAMVAGVAFVVWPKEPTYEGKPLSYWIDNLLPITLPSRIRTHIVVFGTASPNPVWEEDLEKKANAEKAITAIGSGCLPTLLKRLQAKPMSALEQKLLMWAVRRHVIKKPFLRVSYPPGVWAAEVERGQAITALVVLGDAAKPILPDIVKLAKSAPDPGVRAYALEVLRRLSPSDYAQVTGQRT